MAAWLIALSGLIFWAVQFTGLYGLASLADLSEEPGAPGWRLAALVLSAFCMAGAASVPWAVRRVVPGPPDLRRFMSVIATGSAILGIAAMGLQTLAALEL